MQGAGINCGILLGPGYTEATPAGCGGIPQNSVAKQSKKRGGGTHRETVRLVIGSQTKLESGKMRRIDDSRGHPSTKQCPHVRNQNNGRRKRPKVLHPMGIWQWKLKIYRSGGPTENKWKVSGSAASVLLIVALPQLVHGGEVPHPVLLTAPIHGLEIVSAVGGRRVGRDHLNV